MIIGERHGGGEKITGDVDGAAADAIELVDDLGVDANPSHEEEELSVDLGRVEVGDLAALEGVGDASGEVGGLEIDAKMTAHEVGGSHRDGEERGDIAAGEQASASDVAERAVAANDDDGVGGCQLLRVGGGEVENDRCPHIRRLEAFVDHLGGSVAIALSGDGIGDDHYVRYHG
jgi:hypothetical protein